MAITSINLGKIKFNWKGAWSLGVTYVKDDVVRYNGSSYVVVTGHLSATSWAANSSKFELMAEGTTPTTTEGDLIVRGASADERLGIGDSGQVLTVSTSGVPIWADNGVLNKLYYVAPTGSDSNSGQSWGTAFATIKHACSVAVGPATIRVASGSYEEQLPIVVPSYVAVIGDNQRTTIVGPASGYEQLTMWKLGDGALLNKMCFIGLTGYVPYVPDPTNIELAAVGGVYVAFDPDTPIATKSPYIIECTAKSAGGIGALLDGGLHASGNKSMVFHGYTVIMDGGVGYWIKDNAKSEIVSCFTYFCHMGYVATGGGKIRALNGNNSYGTYGTLASGYNTGESTVNGTVYGNMLTWQAGTLVSTFSEGDTITGGSSGTTGTIVNVQSGTSRIYYKKVTGTGFTAGETISNGTGSSATIAAGGVTGQTGVILVVTGLSAEPKPGGSIEVTGDPITYVVQSSSGWTNSGSNVVIVLAADKAAYSTDGTGMKIRYDYSNIRLTGHDFLNIGTGGVASTNYPGVPTQAPAQGNEVVELFPGRIFYVSTDQDGNFRVGEYFKVDQATGRATLNASAFDLSGLTSLRLGSIGAQLGELVNEFSSDITLSGNSNVAVPTERAVKQYFSNVSSDIKPSVTDAYDLGSTSLRWNQLWLGSTASTNSTSGALVAAGGIGINGDSYFGGNLQVTGNITFGGSVNQLSATQLNVDDAIIYIANTNPADLLDLGILGAYNDGTHKHTGLLRDASDGVWKFFTGLASEPTTVADFTGATYAPVKMGALTATTGSFSDHVTVEGVTSTGATGTGKFVFDTAPTIAGGTHTGITSLGIRDTSAAYDVTIAAVSSTTLTSGRTLTVDVVNGARTIKLAGNLTTAGGYATTLTTTADTNVTLPTSGTLYGTASGSITSSQLATSLSDETGTGVAVFGTAPTFTTSIDGGATFSAFASSTTLTIAASTGTTVINNSVGIGSANSAYPLQITKNASTASNPSISISPTTGTNASLIYMNNSGNGGFNVGRSDSTGAGSGATLTAYDSFVWNTGTQALKFGTNNTLAMTIGTDQVVSFAKSVPFAGATTYLSSVFTNSAEVATVSATAATGTIAYYVTTQSVLYYTSNASANWTINITGASTPVTLNTLLSTGQSITVTHLVTQGTTAYYNSSVQVDGTTSGVTTKWQGSAPVQGNASGIDVYTYSVIKTGSAAFTVLAAQSRFS